MGNPFPSLFAVALPHNRAAVFETRPSRIRSLIRSSARDSHSAPAQPANARPARWREVSRRPP